MRSRPLVKFELANNGEFRCVLRYLPSGRSDSDREWTDYLWEEKCRDALGDPTWNEVASAIQRVDGEVFVTGLDYWHVELVCEALRDHKVLLSELLSGKGKEVTDE